VSPHRFPWCGLMAAIVFGSFTSLGAVARADEPDGKPADVYRQFFAQHCQACHAGDKPKGDFRVESLTQDFSNRANRKRWLAVLEQLQEGTMPPAAKPRPPAQENKALT